MESLADKSPRMNVAGLQGQALVEREMVLLRCPKTRIVGWMTVLVDPTQDQHLSGGRAECLSDRHESLFHVGRALARLNGSQ